MKYYGNTGAPNVPVSPYSSVPALISDQSLQQTQD